MISQTENSRIMDLIGLQYRSLIKIIFYLLMMEEELLEVNKKISQIEGVLKKRKERVSQWNLHYKKVLEDKPDKSFYLSRSCSSKGFFNSLKNNQLQDTTKAQIQKKIKQSRIKIREHHNELKELDVLQKQRNKIRAIILAEREQQRKKQKQNIFEPLTRDSAKNRKKQKQNSQSSQNPHLSRTIKERINPFSNVKADKFIEIHNKFRNNQENIGPKLMKHFGVGLQNTPLGLLNTNQDSKFDGKVNKNQGRQKFKPHKSTFSKGFSSTFKEKQKIFGHHRPANLFQNRIRNIIKYYGDFWNQQLDIK